jgi:subtilase family serine protease
VSVGGTQIAGGGTQPISSYEPEAAWNDFAGAGGGGFSSIFAEPSYQGAIADAPGTRALPDVSYNAALISSILIYESFDPRAPAGWVLIGGTSAAAPQWAAVDAIANQADGSLGFLAPRLYQVSASAAYAASFHDITAGNNSFNGITGYSAATGWDPATGLGTPDVAGLLTALKSTSAGTAP